MGKPNWIQRIRTGIRTSTRDKKETPEGLWFKCPSCEERIPAGEHRDNLFVCPHCGFHSRIAPVDYFTLLFNTNRYKRLFDEVRPKDALGFEDSRTYAERLAEASEKTDSTEALVVASGKMGDHGVVIAAMDFRFIGGSMGSVMGERFRRAADHCIEHRRPLILVAKSGGARMMEAGLSLMQMVKTTAALTALGDAGLPYIVLLTDPTTGGVSASLAMLGDLNIAEPGALIGFAGPRVIQETIGKKELPEGFQRAESLLEHGFLDDIVPRAELRDHIVRALDLLKK